MLQLQSIIFRYLEPCMHDSRVRHRQIDRRTDILVENAALNYIPRPKTSDKYIKPDWGCVFRLANNALTVSCNIMFTYSFHHKSRLKLKHMTTVGDLVEAAAAAAVNLHLNHWTTERTLTLCNAYTTVRTIFNAHERSTIDENHFNLRNRTAVNCQ